MSEFAGQAVRIPESVREHMRGRSWVEDVQCPPFDQLALLSVDHWGFDGEVHRGEMVVAAGVAEEVLRAFELIFAAGFPIASMRRIDYYDADDDASMAANNASSFCFRDAPSGRLSEHAFGLAIDINPVQNPMILDDRIYPPAGHEYVDRGNLRPGMIVRPGPVVDAFEAIGWHWGGDWTSLKDYHHFQRRVRR